MSTDSVDVKFGADVTELNSKVDSLSGTLKSKFGEMNSSMSGFQQQATGAAESIKGSFESLTGVFSKVGSAFLAISAAMAGGEAFKDIIAKTNEMAMTANTLAHTLGITAQQGGVLSDALHDVGSSSEQYMGLSMRLGRQLKTQEAAIKSLGVETRDANGNFLNQRDIMNSALSVISQYKDGTDKQQAAMVLFGGRVGDLTMLLRLNDEKLKEVAATQKQLGSEITPQAIAMTLKYKDTMAEVGNVMDAVKKTIGDSLIPGLIAMGEWFASVGPNAVRITKEAMVAFGDVTSTLKEVVSTFWSLIVTAFHGIGDIINSVFGTSGSSITAMEFFLNTIKVVEVAVIGFRIGFETLFNILQTGLSITAIRFAGFAAAANAALHLDFAGAKAAWGAAVEDANTKLQDGINNAVAIAEKGQTDINNALNGVGNNSDSKKYNEGKQGQKHFQTQAKAGAGGDGQMKVYEDNLQQMQLMYQKENHYHEMSKQMTKDYWDGIARITGMGAKDRVAVTQKQAQAELAVNRELAKQSLDLQKEAIDESSKRETEAVTQKEADSKHLLAMGKIDQEEMDNITKQGEDDRFAIAKDAQAKRIELNLSDPNTNPVALQKNLDIMIDLQQSHADKIKNITQKSAEDMRKSWQDMFSPISSAFDTSVKGVIMGTTTMKKAVANMGTAIVMEFVDMGVKRVTGWLADEAAMLFATQAKTVAVGATEAAGSATTVATKGTEATVVVEANAAEGAAGAAASQATIPWVGPEMAIVAFAATMAMILGAKSLIHSSAGGEWNVPSDRLNFVHRNETILPASVATPLRNMVEGGGAAGAPQINISAVDAAGVKRLFDEHGASLVTSLRKQMRAFKT